ncbi:hypothetical protein VULLAG_LOCUS8735 [Vulpes lagopus]
MSTLPRVPGAPAPLREQPGPSAFQNLHRAAAQRSTATGRKVPTPVTSQVLRSTGSDESNRILCWGICWTQGALVTDT